MKKLIIPFLLLFILILSACGNGVTTGETDNTQEAEEETTNPEEATTSETITYQSETGPVDVPANPVRIIALTNAPNVLALAGNIVGVDEWTNMNPLFQEKLNGIEVVTDESIEKIIELEPDLIIVGSWMNNIDKLKKIAPYCRIYLGKIGLFNSANRNWKTY